MNHCMCDIKVLNLILFLLTSLSMFTKVQKHKSHWNGTPETEELNRCYDDIFQIKYKWLYLFYTNPFLRSEIKPYNLKIALALRKIAYPYLWFDDFKKFELPIGELTKLFDERHYEALQRM